MSDIEQQLRSFAAAYPEDLFSPLTKEEVERLQSKGRHLLDRASAAMGRHFAPYAIEAADRIHALERALRVIMEFKVGDFRPLEHEIAIWQTAKAALESSTDAKPGDA